MKPFPHITYMSPPVSAHWQHGFFDLCNPISALLFAEFLLNLDQHIRHIQVAASAALTGVIEDIAQSRVLNWRSDQVQNATQNDNRLSDGPGRHIQEWMHQSALEAGTRQAV